MEVTTIEDYLTRLASLKDELSFGRRRSSSTVLLLIRRFENATSQMISITFSTPGLSDVGNCNILDLASFLDPVSVLVL